MKIALYPGSFNPLHEGHIDVMDKAFCIFSHVILARGINPDKKLALCLYRLVAQ